MPRKRKSGLNEKPQPVFPTHAEINETIRRSIHMWSHHKGPYPLPILDFFINEVGCEIARVEDGEQPGKDDEFYNPSWYVKGITNGELLYSLYTTVVAMTEDAEFSFSQMRAADQQVFASMLQLAIELFSDRREEPEFVGDSVDLWILYMWTRKVSGFDLWQDEDGKPVDPPALQDLTGEDWNMIADDVTRIS